MVSALDLTRVRDEIGDELYYDQTTESPTIIYIVEDGDTSKTPLKITDDYGNPWIYSEYTSDYDGYISNNKAYAVEETADGFILAIKRENGYEGSLDIQWTIYDVSSNGVIDYTSYSNSVTNAEVQFNEDLNLDGAIGFSESALTQKTTDTSGDLLYIDAESNLYIK